MIADGLVEIVLLAEAAIVAGGLLFLAASGVASSAWRAVLGPRIDAARAAVAATLAGGRSAGSGPTPVGRLPVGTGLRVLGEMSGSVAGSGRALVTRLAGDAGLLRWAQGACGSRRWPRRLKGARAFTLIGGGEAIVPTLFDDRRPEVRAQAAEWAADHPAPAVVSRLLGMLDDPATQCRFTVRDSLLRMGAAVVEPLIDALGSRTGADAVRLLDIAVWRQDPRMLGPALRLVRDEDPRARARAATLLGSLGGPDAAEALMTTLDDRASEVRAAAAAALGRMGHWVAGGRLMAALGDRSYEVRRAAGIALASLGAPGTLLLRRALGADDRFAADMARQVLDRPAGT